MNPTRRQLRIALIAIAAIVVIGAGTGAILIARIDPNSYKPEIIQAVKHATGRDLTLNGKITLKPSLWPTIQAEDVAFANPPGFSRPQMATLQRMELQLALLPLLSREIEIDRLLLDHPDILLETNATGQNNWRFTPEASPTAPAGPQNPVNAGGTKSSVSIDTVRIQDGVLGYRDDKTGTVSAVNLTKLEASSSSPDSPLHLDADAVYNGTAVNLAADTGSLSRLQDPTATSPWPLKLTLSSMGAKLAADGSMTKPLQGKGYDLAVNGTIPDLTALAPLLPQFKPPALHGVSFAAKVTDTGQQVPAFSTLTLHVGPSDLGAVFAGLTLDKLDIDAPKADQPMRANAVAKFGNMPLTVAGTFGPPALLLPNAQPAPFPVDMTVQAGGATASAKGTIANAQAMTGANIALAAQIPDLATLSPLARQPLPPLKTVAFQGTLTDTNGGFQHGAALQAFSLTTTDGDLSGNASISRGARDTLTATLKSNHIDLDALQAAFDQTLTTPTSPAPPNTQPPPAPPKHNDGRLFSDQPIPLNLLRTADADLTLTIADLHTAGTGYKAIDTHAVLTNGKLAVNPFAADLPAGHLSGSLTADATQAPPPVHLALNAPGLALKTVLAATHQPPYGTGNLEVYADLSGTGASPHAIAASLDGSLGLAIAGGTIDNRLLGNVLGKVLESLNVLDLVQKGGNSELKCFGLRMDAAHGVGAIKALALSSSLLTMTGLGTVNFGTETLALALRPQARVAGTGLVIPVAVNGPIRNPSVKVNDLGAAEANAGTVASAVIGNATPLGIVGGLLGADKLFGGGTTDICTPALALARGQKVPEAAATAKPETSSPGALLKNLFR